MKLKILTLLLVLGTFTSCNNDDDKNVDKNSECIQNELSYVTSINAPNTGAIDELIIIEVEFQVFNGCGTLGKFIVTEENENIRVIEVEARYEGCICTQDAPLIKANFEFSADKKGDYVLKFKSSPAEFITANLKID